MERFPLPRTNTVFHNSLSPRCPYPSHPQPNELLLSECFPSGAFHPSDHSLQNRHLQVQMGNKLICSGLVIGTKTSREQLRLTQKQVAGHGSNVGRPEQLKHVLPPLGCLPDTQQFWSYGYMNSSLGAHGPWIFLYVSIQFICFPHLTQYLTGLIQLLIQVKAAGFSSLKQFLEMEWGCVMYLGRGQCVDWAKSPWRVDLSHQALLGNHCWAGSKVWSMPGDWEVTGSQD